jgi:hypothetical protein
METFESSVQFSDTKTVNQEVDINAFYFKNRAAQLTSFPKQMEFKGAQYHFADTGLRYLVQKGQELIQLFDVSDGRDTFRLRNEGDEWRLIRIKAGRA